MNCPHAYNTLCVYRNRTPGEKQYAHCTGELERSNHISSADAASFINACKHLGGKHAGSHNTTGCCTQEHRCKSVDCNCIACLFDILQQCFGNHLCYTNRLQHTAISHHDWNGNQEICHGEHAATAHQTDKLRHQFCALRKIEHGGVKSGIGRRKCRLNGEALIENPYQKSYDTGGKERRDNINLLNNQKEQNNSRK